MESCTLTSDLAGSEMSLSSSLLVVLQLAWLLHPPMVDSRSTSPSLTLMTSSGTLRLFWLGAAWVKSRAECPSVSEVNWQLHVQIGCKLRIRNRTDELSPGAVGRCGRSHGRRRTLWAAELYPFNRQTNDECFGTQSSGTLRLSASGAF